MKPTDALTAYPVVNGSVACPLKGRRVPLDTCIDCRRGFVVRLDGAPGYALCPTDRSLAVVGDIMSRRIIAVRPELPIESLILLLVDHGIGAVPVVDRDHRPIGMASKADLVFDRYEWAELRDEAVCLRRVARVAEAPDPADDPQLDELLRSKTVRDVMSGDVFTLTAQTKVTEAARLIAEKQLHGCPVVDASGRLIAMLTSFDITRWVGAG